MQVTLIVVNGLHKGQHIPITTPTFLIGRGKHCHLRPVRQDVGREHCAVLLRAERVFLRDYGSTNGTILNGNVLVQGEVQLADGDVFEVGPLQFRLAITQERVLVNVPSVDIESCFDDDDLFTGEPGEQEPNADSTVLVTPPPVPKPRSGGRRNQ